MSRGPLFSIQEQHSYLLTRIRFLYILSFVVIGLDRLVQVGCRVVTAVFGGLGREFSTHYRSRMEDSM